MKKKVYKEKYYQTLDLDIVIYAHTIAKIGGIESWLYYVGKKYNIGQITVLYNNGSDTQIERLSKELKVIKYTGQKVTCNKIIFTVADYIIPELYKSAKKRYLTVHCNYDTIGWELAEIPQMDKLYAVSETASKALRKIQEQEVFTLYNSVDIDKPKRLLKLISATRLTAEKGLDRMRKLAEELEEKQIPYIWLIFTDRPSEPVSNNIIFMKPRYNMSDYMVNADYGVQLSSSESYCLFVQECLKLKVPVIITGLDVYKEPNITEKEAHILKLDMSNLDVEKIYKKIPKVNYKGKNSDKEYRKLMEVKKDEKESIKKIKTNG